MGQSNSIPEAPVIWNISFENVQKQIQLNLL